MNGCRRGWMNEWMDGRVNGWWKNVIWRGLGGEVFPKLIKIVSRNIIFCGVCAWALHGSGSSGVVSCRAKSVAYFWAQNAIKGGGNRHRKCALSSTFRRKLQKLVTHCVWPLFVHMLQLCQQSHRHSECERGWVFERGTSTHMNSTFGNIINQLTSPAGSDVYVANIIINMKYPAGWVYYTTQHFI